MRTFIDGAMPLRRAILASTSLIGVMIAAPVLAQGTASDADQGTAQAKEIIITGSRLRISGMDTPVPVTAVQASDLKAMDPGNLVSSLSQLPQFYGNSTPNAAGSWFTAGGYGNLNLRGLGINRTLTLLNGRRMISSTAFGGVDINVFPEAVISNVETVTGGASAAYGTDAVAGVANFILDTKFTGFRASAQAGETTRSDGQNFQVSATWGIKLGDRGHLIISGETYTFQGIHNFKGRDWYQGWGTVPDAKGMLLIRPHVVSKNASFDGVIFAPGKAINGLAFNKDGSFSPYVASDLTYGTLGTPPARQSITDGGSGDDLGAEVQTLYPDVDRSSIFAYGDYDVTNDFKVFAQYIRGRNATRRFNAPRGSFGGTPTTLTIFQDNAYLPDALRQTMVANNIPSFVLRRMGSLQDIGANMTLSDESVMNSATTGFTWNVSKDGLFSGWQVEGYYQYGENTRKTYQIGLRVDRIFAAVDAVKDPATGNIVCRTSLYSNAFAGCQPLNLFGRGNASAQAVDWVVGYDPGQTINTPLFFADSGYTTGQTDSYVSQEAKVGITKMHQHIAEFSANGELWKGWGAGPINAAFGASYRQEQIRQIVRDPSNPASDSVNGHPVLCNNDPAAIAAGLRGVSAADCANTVGLQYSKVSNIEGKIKVSEIFGETMIPVIADAPFFKQLSVNLAARWANYSGSGSIWAYKSGIDWTVMDGLRLRGTYSRDVRAANLSERFDKTGGTATVTDPRYPGDGTITTTIYSGGNPDVNPEKADTLTAGIVLQPSVLDGLSVSLDWYQVKIKGAISQLSTQAVVNGCEGGAADLCALVTRDPTTDRLVLVGSPFINIAQAKVEGVDLEASYRRPVNLFGGQREAVSARFFGSWLIENSQVTGKGVDAVYKDRAGQTGIQQSDGVAYALPKFKFTTNLTYDLDGFSAFVQARYIAPGTIENGLVVGKNIESNRVDSAFYVDMRLGYKFEMANHQTAEFFGQMTNVFDKSPPVTPYYSAFLGYAQQYNSQLYDVLGRRFVVGVKVSL